LKSRVGQTWEYDHGVVMVVVRSEDMSEQIGAPAMNHTGLILMSAHDAYKVDECTMDAWYEVGLGPWEELDDRVRLA